MKMSTDIMMVASELVRERGSDAPNISKVRLIELIAANNLRAAAFWRDVQKFCEYLLENPESIPESIMDSSLPYISSPITNGPAR